MARSPAKEPMGGDAQEVFADLSKRFMGPALYKYTLHTRQYTRAPISSGVGGSAPMGMSGRDRRLVTAVHGV